MKLYKMTDGNDCRAYTDALVTINMYDDESFTIKEDRGWVNVWVNKAECGWEIMFESERTLMHNGVGWVKCSDMSIMDVVRFEFIDEAIEDAQDRVCKILDDMGCFNG